MKNQRFLLILALLTLSLRLYPQGVDDAIFNAQTYYEGTARSMAMGNATGAMGGDVTATCINPAGLGFYRSSEFTFSTGWQHNFISSSYYDNRQSDGKMRMSIPNVGLVMSGEVSNYRPLRYFQIGIGLTRTNDFNYRSAATGLNPSSSMVDAYLQTVNGIDDLFDSTIDPGDYLYNNYAYDLSPAWETYLIDRFTDSLGNYYFDSPVPPGNVWQSNDVTAKGRSEEWTFSTATNFYDKLFLGASIGIAHIKHISTRTYKETANDSHSDFFDWSHEEELSDTAWGANFKCGIIYYPASWFRFGVAWHSPTLYSFGEVWSTETNSTLKDGEGRKLQYQKLSPSLYQDYIFQTPNTFIGSLAFFIGRQGMITTDVEYKNYGSCRFSSDDYSFSDANSDIHDILKPTVNFRLGTEWRVRQYFLRGGAAYYGSPFGFGNRNGSAKKLSLGIGYAVSEDTSWDFAYELTESTTEYTPYQCYVDGQNIVNNVIQQRWRNKLVVTMKVKL